MGLLILKDESANGVFKWNYVLSDKDKNILDIVAEKLGKMTKNEIINFMHREQAYAETALKDIIPFKYAENLQI